MYNDDSL
jgi:hypothetical protein